MEATKLWTNQLELNLQQPSNLDGSAVELKRKRGRPRRELTADLVEERRLRRIKWRITANEKRRAKRAAMTPDQRKAIDAERRRKAGDKKRIYDKNYRVKNIDSIRRKCVQREKDRRKNPEYLAIKNLRHRLYMFVRRGMASKVSRSEYVGCTKKHLFEYLESLFKPGMSWENYGQFGWHIDHIRPCSSFDLTDPEQVKQCFHYTNLQPLWWRENIQKSNKWTPNKAA